MSEDRQYYKVGVYTGKTRDEIISAISRGIFESSLALGDTDRYLHDLGRQIGYKDRREADRLMTFSDMARVLERELEEFYRSFRRAYARDIENGDKQWRAER